MELCENEAVCRSMACRILGIALFASGVTCSSPQSVASSSVQVSTEDAAVAARAVVDAGAVTPPVEAPAAQESREPTFDEIVSVLFADRANLSTLKATCPPSLPSDARIRCLFDERYRGDTKAANIAHELYVKWRVVSGVETAHTMDGGYRGMIRLEPALPVLAERRQLEWIASAFRDIDDVFVALPKAPVSETSGQGTRPKTYRWRPLSLRFVRSVGARTPSAYAHDWTVAWNLAGSLHTSADAVRETLVHEIFHLNDYAHSSGDYAWSQTTLATTFDSVVKKCGTQIRCLGPYSPNDTIVRGGTYYSFQPGNGVREYAAELALRYFREQRAMVRGLPKVTPFKCGPPENGRAWSLMRDEFWDGIDLVPPCGEPSATHP